MPPHSKAPRQSFLQIPPNLGRRFLCIPLMTHIVFRNRLASLAYGQP